MEKLKKYGVLKGGLRCAPCCAFRSNDDEDGYFGTDDINVCYRYIAHYTEDEQIIMDIVEKSNY